MVHVQCARNSKSDGPGPKILSVGLALPPVSGPCRTTDFATVLSAARRHLHQRTRCVLCELLKLTDFDWLLPRCVTSMAFFYLQYICSVSNVSTRCYNSLVTNTWNEVLRIRACPHSHNSYFVNLWLFGCCHQIQARNKGFR